MYDNSLWNAFTIIHWFATGESIITDVSIKNYSLSNELYNWFLNIDNKVFARYQ